MSGKPGKTPGTDVLQIIDNIPVSKVPVIKKVRNGSGFYIVIENEGIYTLKKDGILFTVKKIETDDVFKFTDVQSFCEDNQANLWIGSFKNGLIKLIPGPDGEKTIVLFNKSSGFVTDNVKTVYEDLEGNIWSGNYGEGLTQINPRLFSNQTFDRNRYGNTVFAICSDNQYLWIGTGNSLLKTDRLTGKVVSFFTSDSGLLKDTVTAIYKSGEESVWVGTYKNGLYVLNPGKEKLSRYAIGSGTLENSVTTITGR
ncbi:MAG: hypothetical protein A2X04_07060 [Bacteroidetes bacterium GWF2_41_9]|nr:MAG: hypothetical protein A2X04_07060 [Bacteroidetes bacterium GWF2_41_9]